MDRYWDLTEKTRAALTEEQIAAYLNYELMERGVVRLPPPVLEPFLPVAVEGQIYYVIKYDSYYELPIAFATAQAAHAFLQLGPLVVKGHYPLDVHSAEELGEPSVLSKMLLGESALRAAKSDLTENQSRKTRNEAAKSAYEKDSAAVEKETATLRDDWHRCQSLERYHARVLQTWDQYQGMTNGNPAIAWSFLLKAFPNAVESFDWMGAELPAAVRVAAPNGTAAPRAALDSF